MNIKPQKLNILLMVVLALSFLVNWSSPLSLSSTSNMRLDHRNKITRPSDIVLKNGVPFDALFTNESSSHTYKIRQVLQGQEVYFSLNPDYDFNVTLYTPSGTIFEIERVNHETKYLGVWETSVSGNWRIQVDDTRPVKNENLSYSIQVNMPLFGFNEVSAQELDSSVFQANFSIDHENHYWKVYLHDNQNGTLLLKETEQSVLYKSRITIYRRGHPQNPVLPSDTIEKGSYNYSWNAYSNDFYYIVIGHNPDEAFSPLGEYNISFISEDELYNFETAGRLPHNQTISVQSNQPFSPRKPYYFWFLVNSSRANIFLRVFGVGPERNILEDSTIEIYDEGEQNRIHKDPFEEIDQIVDKEFNISLTNIDAGKYYLKISPESNAVGTFYIHFQYDLPRPFVWTPLAILLCFLVLVALPGYLIYLDWKGKWYRINQWTVPAELQDTYKILKNSFSGIFKIKEVPNTSILVPITNIPFKTFGLLNFIEPSEKETLVAVKRLHRKIEWFLYFLLGIIIFDILNFLSFTFFSIHFLPFDVSNSLDLLFLLIIPTIILIIIVLFVNIPSYLSYSQVVSRISYTIENFQESSRKEFPTKSLDPGQALKNINYVRVLWNQAKHAFKESNYELFVIKADAAVKNLLSTRFQQVVSSPIYSKPDFQFQVTNLRSRGFDLPSEKKIAHFRNLRNRIVHSSITLNEKESVDCFAFYSTFIARLGLRSS
ncbi:MAG: hypothetical protein JSW11_03225 [Candidatus Heimdallarchaeota archaeon]|nr:MAG: hypothetical protein JSW11_03225 [Candidatus Heimdallarchaeota archaeon]